jgi:hypothetical protein
MITDTAKTSSKTEQSFHFHSSSLDNHIHLAACFAADRFKQIIRTYARFHLLFFTIALSLLIALLGFSSFWAKSAWLAVSLAVLFLTGFTYFVLLFYFQAKKPEQLLELQREYLAKCQKPLLLEKNTPSFHLFISQAIYHLVDQLKGQEQCYYHSLKSLKSLTPLIEKFSIWMHWKDVFSYKEMLLFFAVNETIAHVLLEPTDVQAHASLASAYLSLSKLYLPPSPKLSLTPKDYASEEMRQKYKKVVGRAIEEFKILDELSPNDLWVQAHLAHLYEALDLPDLQRSAYETILRIAPHDKESVLKLGILYFKQGMNAKGLQVYSTLKNSHDPRAEELISYYSAYDPLF